MDKNNEQDDDITPETIAAAERLAGLTFSDAEREMMLDGLGKYREAYAALRDFTLDNSVAPALSFDPRLPGMRFNRKRKPFRLSAQPEVTRPADLEEVAFYPVTHLAELIRTRQVTAVELAEMYLGRLKRYNPALHCVVTLAEDLGLAQARRADKEIAQGRYRGTLHGIPWGAKDILATRGLPTTWGAEPYQGQSFDADATVVKRLDKAGAVLLAKLTTGALAMGDVWFGGKTRNPWDLEEGAGGSSAGPASAVAAGLVAFAIGSETSGSIIHPCTRCGVVGLRPTFGRVSRHGAMALSWSMDKLGPIARYVEDLAVVFAAIYGPDRRDHTVVNLPFNWEPDIRLAGLRFGYVEERESKPHTGESLAWLRRLGAELVPIDESLALLRRLGAELVPIELPDFPISVMRLHVEGAAAFDELTRSDQDDMLARQDEIAWPNIFRQNRMIPAVEFVQASRLRRLLMEAMADLMAEVDLYAAPSFGVNLLLSNLTGHPAVVVPSAYSAAGKPAGSITFTGRLYDEARLLAVAKIYQDATDFHLRRPVLVDSE